MYHLFDTYRIHYPEHICVACEKGDMNFIRKFVKYTRGSERFFMPTVGMCLALQMLMCITNLDWEHFIMFLQHVKGNFLQFIIDLLV